MIFSLLVKSAKTFLLALFFFLSKAKLPKHVPVKYQILQIINE